MPEKFYWDAGVFLAYFNEEEGRVDACENILNYARKGKCRIFTSSFSLVEVVHIKGRKALTPDREKKLDEFFRSPYISLIDARRNICDEARQLIWRHPNLKPKDATHLASALFGMRSRPNEINSYDNDFL
jgi:predicted nucleic acid-binding protein